MSRPLAVSALIVATMVWGFAFIAQKSAMANMGPLTFIAARYLLGGLVILPLAIREHRRAADPLTRRHWMLFGLMSLNFFMGSWLQQSGLLTTTATNGGFLTGLYVFFVPIVIFLIFRTWPHPIVWLCAPFALLGIFLLNGARLDGLNSGDFLIAGSAVFWAVHVMMLGYLAVQTKRPIFISAVSFLTAGIIALAGAGLTETISFEGLRLGWIEIAYAGILSTAVGFTLQAVGQQHVPPANAAIILSAESLFAAIGGALLLGERLIPIGYLGAAILFVAIVLVETIPQLRRKASSPALP
jgi:drug/metabolite transporter (DMT)-like permease